MAHGAIARFRGDTSGATWPSRPPVPPIFRDALVDFRTTARDVATGRNRTMFAGNGSAACRKPEDAAKYKFLGVRPDTSANLRDVSVPRWATALD